MIAKEKTSSTEWIDVERLVDSTRQMNSMNTQIRGQDFAVGNRFVNLKYLASGAYGMVV